MSGVEAGFPGNPCYEDVPDTKYPEQSFYDIHMDYVSTSVGICQLQQTERIADALASIAVSLREIADRKEG